MFYIACSAETASLVAEETNVEVTVFVAEVASVRGLVSDGIDALYSVCSLSSLDVLVHCTPPLAMASYMALP